MADPLSIPPSQFEQRQEQTCGQCGRSFRPRCVGDGAEELCDFCYDAEFEPASHRSIWEASPKGARSAHRGRRNRHIGGLLIAA